MNIKRVQLRLGFTPLPSNIDKAFKNFKDSIELQFNFWIQQAQLQGSWRSVHNNTFPEHEISKIIEVWKNNKSNYLNTIEKLPEKNTSIGELIYLEGVKPSINKICELLDNLLSTNTKEASVFASWIYTYGISRLDLVNKNTELKQEISKRFGKIEIAPKLKHCCIGLCSACGKREVVYSCTNPIT